MGRRQDRQADAVDARFGSLDNLRRSEPDAVVDDIHARVRRARRDLLGAVRMAVEAGLADEKTDPSAELERRPLDFAPDRVEPGRLLARPLRDARRGAELPELGAKRIPPFSRGSAGLGRLD